MQSLELNAVTDFDLTTDSNLADSNLAPHEFSAFEKTPGLPIEQEPNHHKRAQAILQTVFQFRRVSHHPDSNCGLACPRCQSPHLAKVTSAIQNSRPIHFVLPAFPGKSPNLSKVLGPLPDMAERLALQFLDHLCDQIRKIYTPGAQITLCSDGRVFSDIVGMSERDVTNYQHELEKIITELGLTNLSTFNLDAICEDKDFTRVRLELMEGFGTPRESFREKVLRGALPFSKREDEEAHRMYCGITRFLVGDRAVPGQTQSRSAIQKECKQKATEVILRSNSWSELIAHRFPGAVRLSIHPQACASEKLGIRLIGTESWMTPWHGVAVKTQNHFILLKRTEAEALGAHLVFSKNNRPSHFELALNQRTEK